MVVRTYENVFKHAETRTRCKKMGARHTARGTEQCGRTPARAAAAARTLARQPGELLALAALRERAPRLGDCADVVNAQARELLWSSCLAPRRRVQQHSGCGVSSARQPVKQRANQRHGEKNTCPTLARSEITIDVPVQEMIDMLSGVLTVRLPASKVVCFAASAARRSRARPPGQPRARDRPARAARGCRGTPPAR
jgi:hypothetical protein